MLKLRILVWCSGLEYVICYLYYGGNSCVAAIAYLACEDVVLYPLVLFFILVSLVERSFRGCGLWYLQVWALKVDIWFDFLRREYCIGKLFCIYEGALVKNPGTSSSLIWKKNCRVMDHYSSPTVLLSSIEMHKI